MPKLHQPLNRWQWPLGPREAVTLKAEPSARALWVHEGRVWLTRRCKAGTAEDIWLEAGQAQALPAGSEWVAEAWPQATVSVLQEGPDSISREAGHGWSALLSWWPARRHGGDHAAA
jgi:hypothetical protein